MCVDAPPSTIAKSSPSTRAAVLAIWAKVEGDIFTEVVKRGGATALKASKLAK
jgi:hypothetical protein